MPMRGRGGMGMRGGRAMRRGRRRMRRRRRRRILLVGGLVSRALRDDVSKTPLLGDLPLVGWLFRTTNNNFSQSELFVLVSPSVVRPPVEGSDLWLQPLLGETLQHVVPTEQEPVAAQADDDEPAAPEGDA